MVELKVSQTFTTPDSRGFNQRMGLCPTAATLQLAFRQWPHLRP